MEFPLVSSDSTTLVLPLLTTKKVYWKGVIEELLWFIRADTNAKHLDNVGVKIWNGNSSREALDSVGLSDYEEGDCGPIYGFQWRHFGAIYQGPGMTKEGEGVDQLSECLRLLREDPTSRRIFMSAWNPSVLKEMCLPPCHVSYQFYVSYDSVENDFNQTMEKKKGILHCQMYQRSADMFLGIPFNIASVSLLTHMMAKLSGLIPGKIIIVIGDAHIYEEHKFVVEEQLARIPIYDFPNIRLEGNQEKIEDFKYEDFIIENYRYDSSLKAPMVV
jgi:thymidylate synthase